MSKKPPFPPEPPRGFRGKFTETLKSDWHRLARANQLPPAGDWRIWLLLAGRGFGKTRTICEFARAEVEQGRACRIALIAATASDCRDVLVTGWSGMLKVCPDHARPIYEPTKRLLTWPNGAIATMYSADEPDRLRGPQFDLAICDELAAWRYPEALDMLLLGLRLGKNPRVAIATTPRPTKVIRDLLAREGNDVVVTRGSTLENKDNLAPAYIEQIIERYKGTRLERQEVFGELLEDTPGALWNRENLEQTRVAEPPKDLQRIVVSVDPAGSSEEGADETGIIVQGLGADGHGYVLEDLSGRYDPPGWARRAIGAFHVWKADRIVCETNYGGEMVRATIEAIDPSVPVSTITSSRGKVLRAEPIAAFFEQRKAHMVGSHPELEDQACRFTSDWLRSRDGSPDRIDAMVFGLTELMLGLPTGGPFRASMFHCNDPVFARPPDKVFAMLGTAREVGPDRDGVGVLYCAYSKRGDNAPLVVIDHDLATQDVALLNGDWLDGAWRRLCGWVAALNSENGGLLVEQTPLGAALFALGVGRRIGVVDLSDSLVAFPAGLLERINLTSRFIGTGLVRIAPEAAEKATTFQGVTKNHFLAQVLAYGSSREPAGQRVEFLHALCVATFAALNGDANAGRWLAQKNGLSHVISGPTFSRTAAPFVDNRPPPPPSGPSRAELVEKYQADLAAWKQREQAAIEAVRARIKNPKWRPRTWQHLGIDAPPENPVGGINFRPDIAALMDGRE